MAACDLSRQRTDFNTEDVKKEGQGILLRSGQKHFPKDIRKMSDSMVSGVQTMSLRLQSNTATEIYGTRFLPLLGSDDPLRLKVMRWAHELGAGTVRRTHNLEKTTGSNIIRGEFGVTWKSHFKNVKGFVRNCGICLRFRKEKCRPPLGRTIFRD